MNTARERPNILLIMCDQLRADAVEPETDYVRTPNIAKLADEGFWLSNCFTNAPECMPARASLATGLYPHETGVMQNRAYTLDVERPNWMQAVRAGGYNTSFFGKMHLHKLSSDLRTCEPWFHEIGFDVVDETRGPRELMHVKCHLTARWEQLGIWAAYCKDFEERFATNPYLVRPSPVGFSEYYDVYVPRRAKEYLSDYDRSEPFFCWVSFGGPHEPYDTPEPYASMYDPTDIPPPIMPPIDLGEGADSLLGEILSDKNDNHPTLSMDEIKAAKADYAGSVTLIDDQIGEIVETLKEKGLYENTIIVVTSDHGEMNGDHGLMRKGVFLDASVRVPFIVRLPEYMRYNAPSGRCDVLMELLDLGPTLSDIAGSGFVFESHGKSLLPVIQGRKRHHRNHVLSEFKGERMVATKDWKLVLNKDGKVSLLLDRSRDRDEQENLAGARSVPLALSRFVPGSFLNKLQNAIGING